MSSSSSSPAAVPSAPIGPPGKKFQRFFSRKNHRAAEQTIIQNMGTYSCLGPSVNCPKPPYTVHPHFPAEAECPLCKTSLQTGRSASLDKCHHGFHEACIVSALEKTSCYKCPVCHVVVGQLFGDGPSGTMKIQHDRAASCAGYPNCGTIIITYHIPRGQQSAPCHDHPGMWYSETYRTAYLPDHEEGQQLLTRLKFAFQKGLTFTIGTSLTTGQSNVITWTSIPHKTSKSEGPGPYGFPDPGYILHCHQELDTLGVPPASELHEYTLNMRVIL